MRLLLKHPIPSVAVLPLLPDGRVLLARRVDSDRWSLPGGLVDWGETVEECARRELEEECGLQLVAIERLIGVYSSPDRDPRAHGINVAVAAHVSGTPEIGDPLEISELHAFTPEELPVDALSLGQAEIVRDYRSGKVAVR